MGLRMKPLNEIKNWICTKCHWQGEYKKTMPVMYHAIDWQNCPACGAVAIPIPENFVVYVAKKRCKVCGNSNKHEPWCSAGHGSVTP